jgi:hypothetical protein
MAFQHCVRICYQEELELNGTHQFLVYTYNVNTLGKHINTIKRNKGLLEANKKFCLEANARNTKYMFMSHHQNAQQCHNLLTANK